MPPSTHPKSVSSSARAAGIAYIALAALFALGTVTLVFLAGLGVLVDPSRFAVHPSFAHFIELLPLLMVFAALLARLPRKLLGLTVLLLLLFGAQYAFLYLMPMLGLTPLRALHAVNALAMFWLALWLLQAAWRQLRGRQQS